MIRFARSYWNTYTPIGQLYLTLGLIALVVDAAISYQYGVGQTRLHGLGFALCAIFWGLMPDAAYSEYEQRRYGSAAGAAAIAVILGVVAYYSHLGYGSSVRVGDIQQADAGNLKYANAQKAIETQRVNLEFWKGQLAELQKEKAELIKANPWAVAINADGLRGQIPALDEAIEQEAKRIRCGSVCLGLKNKKADLEARIGSAERFADIGNKIAGLERQIAGTSNVLERATDTAAVTTYQSSGVLNQTAVAAQIYRAVSGHSAEDAIKPSLAEIIFTNLFITGGGALGFMLMAPAGLFLAGRNRKTGAGSIVEAVASGAGHEIGQSFAMPAANHARVINNTVSDRRTARLIADLTAPIRNKAAATA